jgi:hypothetical protein
MVGSMLAATAVWLWAGVPPSQVPADAAVIYVHQGVIEGHGGMVRVVRQGLAPHAGDGRPVVPVVRLRGAVPAAALAAALNELVAVWRARGREVAMVQIDCDAPTARLAEYAALIEAVRARLDRGSALSVTALADWLVAAPPGALKRLMGAADEVVFQLYHRRHPLPDLDRYDRALAALDRPFRVGLLPDMPMPPHAAGSEHNRGAIRFLLRASR